MAAGVGLFPYNPNNVHGAKAFEFLFRGYNRNAELQSKIVNLQVMGIYGSVFGQRLDPSKIIPVVSLLKHEVDKLLFGADAAGEAPEVAVDANDMYKKAFGDIDYEKLSEVYNNWNKKK